MFNCLLLKFHFVETVSQNNLIKWSIQKYIVRSICVLCVVYILWMMFQWVSSIWEGYSCSSGSRHWRLARPLPDFPRYSPEADAGPANQRCGWCSCKIWWTSIHLWVEIWRRESTGKLINSIIIRICFIWLIKSLIQVHYNAEQKSVRIFSRNQEENTSKFPEIVSRLSSQLADDVKECILDCEAVGWDRETSRILPFQILSTRKKKVNINT
jgi:hypothetical protein